MELNEFKKKITEKGKEIKVDITENQTELFYEYMNLLVEWNNNINLTSITEPNEVILKHFIDSLTIYKYIKNASVIDVGTGAGFPGIPLKIIDKDENITLLDSLNKRINFLNEVIDNLRLENIKAIHGRVEEVARDKTYRESFDIAVSRAVAPLNVLLEYMVPLVKVGGKCICMKGSNVEEEIRISKNALKRLNAEIESVENFELPGTDMKRNIIVVKKLDKTDNVFPRKAGTPSKKPL